MLVVTVLAAIMPLFAPATPAPPPAAVPEIGRVRSTTLCTALRQNIAPTVLGLLKDDEIISAGHRAFAKMGRDAAGSSSGALDIDKLYLEQVETRLVHNLQVVDKLLGDDKRFPTTPRSDDERTAVALKTGLLAVAEQQRKALDLVSGTLETESLGQMQHDIDNQMRAATSQTGGQPQTAATADPIAFLGTAGLPDTPAVAGLPTTASKVSNVGGHTVYDAIAAALENAQNTIARREQAVSPGVVSAAGQCRATVAPSPNATASP